MEKQKKPTVAVDLDGVLAQYDGKWRGVESIGEPIPGAVEFTQELSKNADVIIWTTRTNPEINYEFALPDLRTLVVNWLNLHGFAYRSVHCGGGKPLAAAYVDDRAVACEPQQAGAFAFEVALMRISSLLPAQAGTAKEQAPPSQKRSS